MFENIFFRSWILVASENIFRTDVCLSDTPNTSTLDSGVARHPKPHRLRDTDVENPRKSWIFRIFHNFFWEMQQIGDDMTRISELLMGKPRILWPSLGQKQIFLREEYDKILRYRVRKIHFQYPKKIMIDDF